MAVPTKVPRRLASSVGQSRLSRAKVAGPAKPCQMLVTMAGKSSSADIVAQCRALADAGIQQALFNMPNVQDIRPLEIFGREIIPAVAEF